ncbi:hypothetical protein L1987_63996 [Smallanthus sonchifolius]|uniref:Uncharacterized protein n=1 Tax=Smallanthus sonchifolius TaxID=185202 RepID=A0ACB9CER9_9ASTR|nr:hypothetical protein L1987_63996 [Smallanthus sonchifolius]
MCLAESDDEGERERGRFRSGGDHGKQTGDRMMVTGSGDGCERRTRWCSTAVVATEVVVLWRREAEDDGDGGQEEEHGKDCGHDARRITRFEWTHGLGSLHERKDEQTRQVGFQRGRAGLQSKDSDSVSGEFLIPRL